MALEQELQTYARELQRLLPSAGKYVLIKDDKVVDVYDSYSDALKIGYERFGVNTPFLVKRIQVVEQAQCFTRDFIGCHT